MTSNGKSPFGDPSTQVGRTLLEALSSAHDPTFRAMARNLLCDHRIPAERATEFLKLPFPATSINEIKELLRQYQSIHVRPFRNSGQTPSYANPSNVANLVEPPSGGQLCTVLNLTRWVRYYVEANKTFSMSEFRSFEFDTLRQYEQVNAKLAEKLSDPNQARPFLTAIFRARNRYMASLERQWQPLWAADWHTIEPFLTHSEPRHWQQAVGVSFPDPAWLVVVKYPVESKRRKITLYRPTQLEAGWYAQHFPSPPQTPLAGGGHTMFLTALPPVAEPPRNSLVSEYIHQEPNFEIEDWIQAGERIGLAQPISGDLEKQRTEHHALLKSKYDPQQIMDWMPNPC